MMSEELISIIVPVHNEAAYVKAAVSSVINQTRDNWELIIIDDHSTDGSFEICALLADSHESIFLYKRPETKPRGSSACRNFGVDKSLGEYLIFLDADDVLKSKCIENRTVELKKRKEDLLVFKMAYLNGETIAGTVNRSRWNDMPIRGFLRYDLPWPVTAVIWRKKVFKTFYYDERFRRLVDPDLHFAFLINAGYTVGFVDDYEADCLYRITKRGRWKEEDFSIVVAESFLLFCQKWSKHIEALERLYRNDFKLFILESFKRIYRVKNVSKRKRMLSTLLTLIKQYRFFTKKEIVLLEKVLQLDNRITGSKIPRYILTIVLNRLKKLDLPAAA